MEEQRPGWIRRRQGRKSKKREARKRADSESTSAGFTAAGASVLNRMGQQILAFLQQVWWILSVGPARIWSWLNM
ncbi:hypothetical protein MTO96_008213 [Rhipicephalus appendiculatus]